MDASGYDFGWVRWWLLGGALFLVAAGVFVGVALSAWVF